MTEVQISAVDEEQLDTVLAGDVEFSGSMTFKKPLMIKGRVSGVIRSESELYIDEKAVVEADIKALVVSVKGSVKGDIAARERVELFASSSVDGDVTAPQITMETGCRFNGACKMAAPDFDAR
ncbi:MAG TPA: polymer-forming cytoskeletal protein [Spirochaetia bacterium]|nr:polymer-forming cytoskeletal protein [Spirochaetales bacterium]HRY72609.1 polymer-forming cytoskeletal protein [Spirochaetia bacterium]